MATTEKRRLVKEHLVNALDADDLTEKEFHVREALQLLSIEER